MFTRFPIFSIPILLGLFAISSFAEFTVGFNSNCEVGHLGEGGYNYAYTLSELTNSQCAGICNSNFGWAGERRYWSVGAPYGHGVSCGGQLWYVSRQSDYGPGVYWCVCTCTLGIKEERSFADDQNDRLRVYPNPSFGNAVIKYGLPKKANMTLSLYDISGRLVKTIYSGTQEKGYQEVDVKQDELKGGIYFIRFEADKFKATRKLTIIR